MKSTPPDVVGQIKAIIFQDKRERLAAGYLYGSRGIADRIAAAFGLSVHTVHAIKERQRHRKTPTNKKFLVAFTVPPERLQELRKHNERILRRRSPVPDRRLLHYWHRFFNNHPPR